MTVYFLEVETLWDIDGGETVCYYSKGHHDPEKFVAEAAREFEVIIDPAKVKQKYMRWEMFNGPDGPRHVGAEHTEPMRGAFPVTIADEWKELGMED